MITKELFQMALNVTEPWFVSDLVFDAEAKRLDIYIDFKKGSTFRYFDQQGDKEYAGLKAYDTSNKTWRHLNFFEHECYLHARVPRVKLPNGKVKRITTPWEGLSNGFTLLFEALALQLCQAMPVSKVAKITQTSDDKLWHMLERYIDTTREEENFEAIDAIGLDETSRAKGHEYITLFVDLQQRRTIFITEGKDNTTVQRFAKDFEAHSGHVDNIAHVSCDMSPAFIKGVTEYLPNAQITFDKFHILKIINEAVDKVRKEEVGTNKLLKGTKYIWLKNYNNLTKKQKEELESFTLSKMNIKTLRAYNIRQAFQEIYHAETKDEFITYLNKWYYWATHSRLDPIIKAAKTIKRHWEGIVRWYESKINNGILEGLNSVIQAAKSKARGYKTFKNYKIIVYLLTGKLDFSQVNPRFREI
ncbi:Mobile element protein [hydrothermal vent metagenome]|uniref:Mobile element protein n=1 Tax=hydrothermal vent metagenome TaxID=652676 RepID=A0A1W1C222_9ZZZZ